MIIIAVMLVLALDTTTATGSCALTRDGIVVRERSAAAAHAHAERLPGALMSLLDAAGIALKSIDAFAVATGPGSFTGLRIGIATMQGLAFAEQKPLIGVSGLDALATIAARERAPSARVATWVDAWRGEVFAALYDEGRQIESPSVSKPERLLERLKGNRTTFIGDGADVYRDDIRRALGDNARIAEPTAPPLAGIIAILGTAAVSRGDATPPDAIRPVYVRRTDAELARDARAIRS